jgi:hypothetical protein
MIAVNARLARETAAQTSGEESAGAPAPHRRLTACRTLVVVPTYNEA